MAARPLSVGCDLELVEPRSALFVRDYFTAAERERVAAAPAREHDELANLIWCAKESALKVLRTGLRRDTRSVEVELGTSHPIGRELDDLLLVKRSIHYMYVPDFQAILYGPSFLE